MHSPTADPEPQRSFGRADHLQGHRLSVREAASDVAPHPDTAGARWPLWNGAMQEARGTAPVWPKAFSVTRRELSNGT